MRLDAAASRAHPGRRSPGGSGRAFGGSRTIAYKWLHRGAIDPDDGTAWGEAGDAWIGDETRFGLVYACADAGLAYGIDSELWKIELRDLQGTTPFPEQRRYGGDRVYGPFEHRILARRGRLIGRVEDWTEAVATEFAAVCAARVRSRAARAMADALRTIGRAEARAASTADAEHDPSFLRIVLDPAPAESLGLLHGKRMLSIWLDARSVHAHGAGHPAHVYATAAAASRAAAALVYASSSNGWDRRVADLAYADERRWQARWLADRVAPARPAGVRRTRRLGGGVG